MKDFKDYMYEDFTVSYETNQRKKSSDRMSRVGICRSVKK